MRRVGLLALGVVLGDLPATDKPTDAGQAHITGVPVWKRLDQAGESVIG